MRVIVGTIAGLGLAVTVAAAQPPIQPGRAAALGTPVPLAPSRIPTVARGVADDLPPSGLNFPTTPLKRGNTASASGPGWLNGADPNVKPAAGTVAGKGARPLVPQGTGSKDESPSQLRFLGRLKGTGEKQPTAPAPLQPNRLARPHPETPTARTPFRGTGANGAPVYAGPPAYRWYGWGSVTPGANPLAPAGQYPKASANWYSITGATPGAFPVPIANGVPVMSGTEPPHYGLARTVPAPQAEPPVRQYQPNWQPQPVSVQPSPRVGTQTPPPIRTPQLSHPESKFLPGTTIATPTHTPVGVPTLTPPPGGQSQVAVSPAPKMPAPVIAPLAIPVPLLPERPKSEAVAALPPLPVIPPVEIAKPLQTVPEQHPTETTPSPLPTSVRTEQPRWQPAAKPMTPAPGTWAPAQGHAPLPTVPVGASPAVGSLDARPVVARGQIDDSQPDSVAALIQSVCQGRAGGVEVRHSGTKKLQVCFEVRNAPEAKKLVAEISKRPELIPYQIDFCVLVK